MTDLKFNILTEIYESSFSAKVNESLFYMSKGEDFPEIGRAVRELRKAGHLKAIGDNLEMTSAGIAAMEEEARVRRHREEDIKLQRELAEKTAKDAKKARVQQWIAIGISAILSIAAFIKSFF